MVENRQLSGKKGNAYAKPEGRVMPILKRLWTYMSKDKPRFALAVFLSLAGNALALIGPKLSGLAIDAIGTEPGAVDYKAVAVYCVVMAVMYAASAVIMYALSLLMIRISRTAVKKMRNDVFAKLTALPVSFFDRHLSGDVISTVSYDIDTVNASLSNDLVQLLANVVTVVVSLAMLISISPKLVLVFAVTIPLSVLFTRYRSRKVRPLYLRRSAKLGEMNGYIEEMTSGHRTVKAYGAENAVLGLFSHKNEQAIDAYYKADRFSCATGPSVSFLNNISLALISVFGSVMFLGNALTLGALSSFVLYSRKFSGPINEFANILSELQSSLAAAQRVFRLLDTPSEPPDADDAGELEVTSGKVMFNGVSFGYSQDAPVLENLTLTAKPGKVIAIVGETGAGKTTVINLLMRFYEPDSGCITIDGTDISHVTRASLRRAFTMVLQDTWLFGGTVYENLTYGHGNIPRERVEQAARAAKIHKFIMSLPLGYDTVLSDNGVNISKGQKQLLTIARAMLTDAEMLILDEATSNVDTSTERDIQDAMLNLMHGRTSFVIAHRLSTIRNADEIILLENGIIAECGTHSELMELNGRYANMYNSQFE